MSGPLHSAPEIERREWNHEGSSAGKQSTSGSLCSIYSLHPVLFGVTGQNGFEVFRKGVTLAEHVHPLCIIQVWWANTCQDRSSNHWKSEAINEIQDTWGKYVVQAKCFVLVPSFTILCARERCKTQKIAGLDASYAPSWGPRGTKESCHFSKDKWSDLSGFAKQQKF